MNDLTLFADKIKNFKTVYLAGGIQNRNNPESWRVPLTRFFESNNIEVYDPVKDNENIFNSSVLGFDVKYLDGTESFGTWTEFKLVYDLKKPFIIIRTESRKNLPDWIKWRRYFALIIDKIALEFRSFEELKRFFIEYLEFKDE